MEADTPLSYEELADLAEDVRASQWRLLPFKTAKRLLATIAQRDATIAQLKGLLSIADEHAEKLRVAHNEAHGRAESAEAELAQARANQPMPGTRMVCNICDENVGDGKCHYSGDTLEYGRNLPDKCPVRLSTMRDTRVVGEREIAEIAERAARDAKTGPYEWPWAERLNRDRATLLAHLKRTHQPTQEEM